ncbi:hypothetical protein HG536_0B04270 [Torulaspora globosa]|uniref:Ty3 transposon capsid-like protein domain-containing protein n=1 Tax=Torulaspora globosa TaxID=48254 RepID=A0A7G3ZDH7_9SACH|nr:uncharacterized protein HG536_0B04270 [Torulaspora globosa]QLL31563.1 hypothetical protein HG536_0B04270 [Torulaspora globosa]
MVEPVIMSNQNIPNASKPPKFSGQGEPLAVAAFMTRISIHLRRFEFTDDYEKILYFADCLTEGAALWFEGLTGESLRQGTFNDFIGRFKRKYYSEHQVDSILTHLRYCKQQGSLESYNKEYNALSAAIPDELLSPKCKQSFYLSGLEKSLQITVRNLRPDLLETAMILASSPMRTARSDDSTRNKMAL